MASAILSVGGGGPSYTLFRANAVPQDSENLADAHDEHKHSALADRINQIIAVVILLNVIEVGAEHQWKVVDYPDLLKVYLAFDCAFAVLYSCEVAFGFVTEGCNYWFSPWNIANLVLTALAIASIVADVTDTADLSGTELLRMVRFVRLVRLLRLLNAIPDLVMVVEGLMSSLQSLSWVLFLLVIIMWVFGIFFTMTISDDYKEDFEGIDYFGDMAHSMMTLMDIAFLAEWGPVVRPVFNHQPYLLPFFIIFVLTSAFGMLNVMIGVIVEKTHEAKHVLETKVKNAQIREASETWRRRIDDEKLSRKDIRNSHPTEVHSKQIRRTKVIEGVIEEILHNPNSIKFPSGLSVDDVISLLDFDANGNLSHKEFVDGLERLVCGDEFQLTCLTLTVLGKLRKEHADASANIDRRLARIEEALNIAPMEKNNDRKMSLASQYTSQVSQAF